MDQRDLLLDYLHQGKEKAYGVTLSLLLCSIGFVCGEVCGE